MPRSKSSSRWLKEHVDDPYVQRAQRDGYRARSAYKLLEVQEKDHLIKPGMQVLDLGAAPGSWSQVVARILAGRGRVVATDILPMDPLPGVEFIQGDFREEAMVQSLLDQLFNRPVDLVLSDMAPNISGMDAVDQARSMNLCELALDLADRVLKPGGAMLVKVFQGEGSDAFRAEMAQRFSVMKTRKPKASRPRSREVYFLGLMKKSETGITNGPEQADMTN